MQAQLCPSPAPAAAPKSKAAPPNLTLSACAVGLCAKVCVVGCTSVLCSVARLSNKVLCWIHCWGMFPSYP